MSFMTTIIADQEPMVWIQADRRMGELLWSAVRHGGLLDPSWWRAWSIGVQSSISIEGHILAVDMHSADPEDPTDRRGRRWVADPVTKILIARWHRDGLVYDGRVPLAKCMALFLGPDAAKDIASGKFLKTAQDAWAFRLPGLMLAYAKGAVPSKSVSQSTWEKILHGCHRPLPEAPVQTRARRQQGFAERSLLRSLGGELRALQVKESEYDAGRKAKTRRKTTAARNIEGLPPHNSSLQRCLRQWCVYGLKDEKRGRHSKGYSPDTVKSYLKALVRLFADWGPSSPLDAGAVALEAQIVTYLDKTAGRARTDAVKAVISFLRFQAVVRPGNALHIDMDEYSAEENASPDLLLPGEYRRVMRALDQRGDADLAMMIMLMFRAGLRLDEVVALQVGDVNVSDRHVELIVETNVERSLKTKGSRRILPLDALLEPQELIQLVGRVQERRAASRFGIEAWLFGRATAMSPPAEDVVAKQVRECLFDVAGLRKLTAAHLRHSFASYLLATLMLPADGSDDAVPAQLRSVISSSRAAQVADRLLGHGRLGSGALHAISQLMGHAGPHTTLRYYCHLLDLSLGIFCNRAATLVPFDQSSLLALTGVSADARRKAVARAQVSTPSPPGGAHSRPSGTDVMFWSPHAARKKADASMYASTFHRLSRQLARELAADVQIVHLAAQPKDDEKHADETDQKDPPAKKYKPRGIAKERQYAIHWRAIEAAILTPSSVSTDRYSATAVERWRSSARQLIPKTITIATTVPSSAELRRLIDRRLCLSREPHRAERFALAVVTTRWHRGCTDIRLARLKDAEAFVSLLGVMGFAQEEVDLSLTSVRGHGMTSQDVHRFLADRRIRPRLAGRSGWRGSLVVRLRPKDVDHPILAAQACRMALLMLAIDLHANRPLSSTHRMTSGRPAISVHGDYPIHG